MREAGMPGEQRPHKRARRLRIDPLPDIEAAKLVRNVQIAIDKRNALSGAVLSDDELEREMVTVLALLIPAAALIAAPLVQHLAGRKMAIAGTGNENPSPYEIRDALREPERFRSFYPEAMRAGTRGMIELLRPFWPPKLANNLEASLNDLEEGRLPKMLTPEKRGRWIGSLPDRKRFALCLASEVEFQKAANPNFSRERVIRMVAGLQRTGYCPGELPPLMPLPFMKWETITNSRGGLLAFARAHFSQALEEAAQAGQLVASGKQEEFERTDFARFRKQYLRTTPVGWEAMWARVRGKVPKAAPKPIRASKSRRA